MEQRLILFAKRPRSGRVKTRLARTMGNEQALALYRCFLRDQLGFLRTARLPCRELEVSFDGVLDPLDPLAHALAGIAQTEQEEGDLGRRMLAALTRSHAQGRRGVIVGTDVPTLPLQRIDAAFDALDAGADAVVVPAQDGGYALIGTTLPPRQLFVDVPWGADGVLAATRRHARRHRLALVELAPWYDIDDSTDLKRLQAECRRPEIRRRAPATCRWLDAAAGSVV